MIQQTTKLANFQKVDSAQSHITFRNRYKFLLFYNNALLSQDIHLYEAIVEAQSNGYNRPVTHSFISISEVKGTNYHLRVGSGWHDIEIEEADFPIVEEAIIAVRKLIGKDSVNFESLELVQAQGVTGIQYRFVINFEEGRFKVLIWKKMDGSLFVLECVALSTGEKKKSKSEYIELNTEKQKVETNRRGYRTHNGPRCKDGSLDMRYAANRGRDKYND